MYYTIDQRDRPGPGRRPAPPGPAGHTGPRCPSGPPAVRAPVRLACSGSPSPSCARRHRLGRPRLTGTGGSGFVVPLFAGLVVVAGEELFTVAAAEQEDEAAGAHSAGVGAASLRRHTWRVPRRCRCRRSSHVDRSGRDGRASPALNVIGGLSSISILQRPFEDIDDLFARMRVLEQRRARVDVDAELDDLASGDVGIVPAGEQRWMTRTAPASPPRPRPGGPAGPGDRRPGIADPRSGVVAGHGGPPMAQRVHQRHQIAGPGPV